MPSMSAVERAFCRSAPWAVFTRHVTLPWALGPIELVGDVLEVGGGDGTMSLAMSERFPQARITTTDIDHQMVKAARRRHSGARNVSAVEADATRLPFPDGSFDHVVSFLMLHHVIEWPGALAEALRVLRPGGSLRGYDLTDSRLSRAIHWADRSPHRLIAADAFGPALRDLGYGDVVIRPSFRGHIVRFTARAPRSRVP